MATNGKQAEEPTLVDILIDRGIVVTMDERRQVIEDGAVAVDGRHIIAVERAPRLSADTAGARSSMPRRKRPCPLA